MKRTLLAVAAIAALAVPTTAPALAYPAGQAPVLAFSTVGRIVPGDNVQVQISRVKKNCSVTIGWSDSDQDNSVTKVIKATGKSGVISIQTPDTAGEYTLSTTISQACAGGDDSVTLTKKVMVGKLASIVAKMSTSSAFVSKNPTLSVSGTIKSGSVAVANKTLTLTLYKGGVYVKDTTVTTSGTGTFTKAFTGTSYTAGNYTVGVTLPSGTIYGETSVTTAILKLR